jgi:hypothetical protein
MIFSAFQFTLENRVILLDVFFLLFFNYLENRGVLP